MKGRKEHNYYREQIRKGIKALFLFANKCEQTFDFLYNIALSQLANYGVIYLDEYDAPVDDEYLLEELAKGE